MPHLSQLRGLHNTARQLASLLAGFVIVVILLESGGLVTWAQRLEVGQTQQVALRATTALNHFLAPLRLGQIRTQALTMLTSHGWNASPDEPIESTEQAATSSEPIALTPSATQSDAIAQSAASATSEAVADNTASTTSEPIEALSNPLPVVHGTSTLVPLPQATPGNPRVLALAGDSMMAVGLGAQLQRDLAKYNSIKIVRAFRSGTGLARPEVFDWMKEYPGMLGKQKPDVVICAIGANDGQGFVENGKVLPFGSPEWQQVYEERATHFLNMLTSSGAVVLWVQLPPMKSPKFNDKIQEVNRIAHQVVAKNPRAIWWDPSAYITDENGRFRDFAPLANGKKTARIRAGDGIHLSDDGAGLITPMLVEWLNPADPKALAAASEPVAAPSATSMPNALPEPMQSASGILSSEPLSSAPSPAMNSDLK